ncbi:hypothetical protein JCM24511_04823 [Saitozyma sp. JCM 24511]|nr:hypothetical protein JCM24511_04823 [Saitozyma sp. JCM 24511]
MKRIKHLLSSLGFGARHESDGAQTDIASITEPEPSEPADTLTLVDRIRHELAASSVSVFSGRLSRIDVLVEDNGIQLGLTLSSASQAEIHADTRIYSAAGCISDLSEADLSECFSRLQQLLNPDVANSALEKLQALISGSRTLLHAEVDTSRYAQVISVGTRAHHVILGSYKVSDPSSTLWYLKLRLQTGDPTGRLRLEPIELESKRVRG